MLWGDLAQHNTALAVTNRIRVKGVMLLQASTGLSTAGRLGLLAFDDINGGGRS
jgi:hypothetical protein